MAITQDRMLALIAAALFYQASYARLADLITKNYSRTQKSPTEAQTTMTLLYGAQALHLSERLVHDPVIGREEYHFKKFAKRNEYTRRYAAGKRLMEDGTSSARYTRKSMPQAPAQSNALARMIAKRDELEAQSLMHAAEAKVAALEAAKTLGLGVNLVDSTPTDPSLVTKLDIKIL